MTINFIDTDATSIPIVADNQNIYLEKGVRIIGDPGVGNHPVDAGGQSNIDLTVAGTIRAKGGHGVRSDLGSSNINVTVAEGGLVRSDTIYGIHLQGVISSIINYGKVVTKANTAILMQGDFGLLENFGIVKSAGAGLIVDGNATVGTNAGSVTATSAGVRLLGATAMEFYNSGTITSGTVGIEATLGSTDLTIQNSGDVFGEVRAIETSGTNTNVVNSGTLRTNGTYTVEDGTGTLHFVNAGRIVGDVYMGNGDDQFFNAAGGRVTGTVFGGLDEDFYEGNDRRDTFDGGAATDVFFGMGGNDLFIGGTANDTAFGGEGNDTLKGQEDNDTLFGDLGDDLVIGGSGDDFLFGQEGNDDLRGGVGADTIFAGVGRDVLDGGDGDDNLFAEGGRNRMIGGLGADDFNSGTGRDRMVTEADGDADVFIYEQDKEGRDKIIGFEDNIDNLDFTTYGVDFGLVAADILAAAGERGGDLFFDLSDLDPTLSGTIKVVGMSLADFDGFDFQV